MCPRKNGKYRSCPDRPHRRDRERISYLGKNPGRGYQALGAVLGGRYGSGVGAVFQSQEGEKIKGVGKYGLHFLGVP